MTTTRDLADENRRRDETRAATDHDAGWGDYPVDSTLHRCCQGIGGHTRDCRQGPAAVFAAAARAADHHPAVRQSLSSGCWLAACSCGWRWPPCITEDTAREAMAVHYLGADPLAADPEGSLLAAMRRHPAGGAL